MLLFIIVSASATTQSKNILPVPKTSIKKEILEYSESTEWTQPNIDLDLTTLNNQTTLEIDFSECQNNSLPSISKHYFVPKNQQKQSDFLYFPEVKIEIRSGPSWPS